MSRSFSAARSRRVCARGAIHPISARFPRKRCAPPIHNAQRRPSSMRQTLWVATSMICHQIANSSSTSSPTPVPTVWCMASQMQLSLELTDSGADGWNGAAWTISESAFGTPNAIWDTRRGLLQGWITMGGCLSLRETEARFSYSVPISGLFRPHCRSRTCACQTERTGSQSPTARHRPNLGGACAIRTGLDHCLSHLFRSPSQHACTRIYLLRRCRLRCPRQAPARRLPVIQPSRQRGRPRQAPASPTGDPTATPTRAPSPFPTTVMCTSAPSATALACKAAFGGTCASGEATCNLLLGGQWDADGCGAGSCGCCYAIPTPAPTPAECSSAPSTSQSLCDSIGGDCYSSNASCADAGGQLYDRDFCGSSTCGCCVGIPSSMPSAVPSSTPTHVPTVAPSATPTPQPSPSPTYSPTAVPSTTPSAVPTPQPSQTPSGLPSPLPTAAPSPAPSQIPSLVPTATFHPTRTPTPAPTGARVLFKVTLELAGIECAQYDAVAQIAVRTAVGSFIPGASAQHFGNHTCVENENGRRSLAAATDGVQISTTVTVDSARYNSSDVQTAVSAKLSRAASSGALENSIVDEANSPR